MASKLGACDLVRLSLAISRVLFGSGRQRGHFSSNSLNDGLFTEAQNHRCRQHGFQVHQLLRSRPGRKTTGLVPGS